MVLRRIGSLLAVVAALAGAALSGGVPAGADAVRSAQWYLSALGVDKAWSVTRGNGVKVAVIDSGVDGSIPDLRGAVVGGKDFSGHGSANGQLPIESSVGTDHGTNVASVLAGRGTGGGVIGTAPAASLLSASVDVTAQNVAQQVDAAVRWSVDAGARVVNLSLGLLTDDQIAPAVRYAEAKDVVVVAATGEIPAGSPRAGLSAPADLPGVVAVTGVDQNLRSDPNATIGHGTALAAPYATVAGDGGAGLPVANPGNSANGRYSTAKGTSFSAPVVAGVAALIRAAHPDLDAANVVNRLVRTATRAGGTVPNDTYGYGIVDAFRAVTATVASVAANPLGSLATASTASPGAPSTPATASQSAPAPAAEQPSTSSGLGAGAWAAIVVVLVLAGALIAVLVARSRRAPSHPV